MPWAQAKLLSHYLQVNIDAWEINNGKIGIPEAVLPQLPPPLTPDQEKDPKSKATFEAILKHQKRFMDSLK